MLARNQVRLWCAAVGQRSPLAVFVALALVAGFAMVRPSVAHAYSCGNASSGHCYAIETTGISGAQGVTTKIYMVHLQCSQCGGVNTTSGFIDNEMWFNASTYDWVEAGYIVQSNLFSSWQDYFWADSRPVDCSGCVNFHDLGGVPSGDYGQNPTFTIKRTSSTSFHVSITSPNVSLAADSTGNTMDVASVDMGQELAGNAGASAPNARFSYRYYWNSSGSYVGIFSNYSPYSDNPPYLGYISGDTDFYTHCC